MPAQRSSRGMVEDDSYGQRPSYYHSPGSYQGYARADQPISMHAPNMQQRPVLNAAPSAPILPYNGSISSSYTFNPVSALQYSTSQGSQRPSSTGAIVSPTTSYGQDNSYPQLPGQGVFPPSPQEYFSSYTYAPQYGSQHSRSPSVETRVSIHSAPTTPLNLGGGPSDFMYPPTGYPGSSAVSQTMTASPARSLPQEYRVSLEDLADPEPGQAPGFGIRVLMQYAIQGSPEGRMSLNDIYEAIERRFPYFRSDKNFRNTARHDISLHPQFVKVPRRPDEPGKGHMWTYDPTVPAKPRKPRAKKAKAKSRSPTGGDSDASARSQVRGNDQNSTAPAGVIGSMTEVTNHLTFVNLAR